MNSLLTIVNPLTKKGVRFDCISSAEIKTSIRTLGDTATVVIPRHYQRLRPHKDLQEESIFSYIRVGERVTLDLGYNGEYSREFTGYVREISAGGPVKLYLDDDFYPLKKGDIITKSWESVSLKTLLKAILPGWQIDCPDLLLSAGWQINKKTPYSALYDIQQQIGFYSRVDMQKKSIYCYWPYSFKTARRHVYDVQKNVKKSRLTYKRKEDVKIKIKAAAPQKTGRKLHVEVGSNESDARVISRNFNYVSSEAELKKLAEKELQTLCFNGYEGTITGFGLPRTRAGDSLKIIDAKERDRQGVYLIESTTIRYGEGGFERENRLSYKL